MNITLAYQILEVSENISEEELKKKFKSLVLKYHPDRNKASNSTQKFIEIKEAYDLILKSLTTPKNWIDDYVLVDPYANSSNFTHTSWTFTFNNG